MNHENLAALKDWFAGYVAAFSSPEPEDQRNLDLKKDHTTQVCLNIRRIAQDLRLEAEDALLAEAVGLFHDVGRFEQYRRYKTFDDAVSVNHAALGAGILLEKKALSALSKREQDLIVRSVTLHNVYALPKDLDSETLLFARLVRDADKLDILRVVIEYYGQAEGSRAEAVSLGLSGGPEYSAAVLACLMRGKMARKSDLTTQNDFKLLQLAWLYDLNFTASLRMVLERSYIDKLAGLLPRDNEISRAVAMVRQYVDEKVRSG
jgi:hypothetical protein